MLMFPVFQLATLPGMPSQPHPEGPRRGALYAYEVYILERVQYIPDVYIGIPNKLVLTA